MLSLALVLALSPHWGLYAQSASAQSAQNLPPANGAQTASEFIPFGQAVGSYTSPTLYKNGEMLALLEDASGKPLWVLQAEIMPSGNINGDLSLLRYGSNPAKHLPALQIAGHAVLDASGKGVFSATIYTKYFGQIPVAPMGSLSGVLKQEPLALSKPMRTLRSGLAARFFDGDSAGQSISSLPPVIDGEGRVIVCESAPGFSVGSVESAGNLAQGGGMAGAGIISVPHVDGVSVSNVQSAGQAAAGSGQMAGQGAPQPAGQGSAQVAEGSGSIVPTGVEGDVCLRWFLLP